MTLAYSEANLLAGLLAAPAYALSRSPYLALNLVLVASFALSALAMFALVGLPDRRPAGRRRLRRRVRLLSVRLRAPLAHPAADDWPDCPSACSVFTG